LAHADDYKAGDFSAMLPLEKMASAMLFCTKMGANDEVGLMKAFDMHLGDVRFSPLVMTLNNDFEMDGHMAARWCRLEHGRFHKHPANQRCHQ